MDKKLAISIFLVVGLVSVFVGSSSTSMCIININAETKSFHVKNDVELKFNISSSKWKFLDYIPDLNSAALIYINNNNDTMLMIGKIIDIDDNNPLFAAQAFGEPVASLITERGILKSFTQKIFGKNNFGYEYVVIPDSKTSSIGSIGMNNNHTKMETIMNYSNSYFGDTPADVLITKKYNTLCGIMIVSLDENTLKKSRQEIQNIVDSFEIVKTD